MEWTIAFITNADKVQYGALNTSLRSDYMQGVDKYPKTRDTLYN
jgi:hypothetical protein